MDITEAKWLAEPGGGAPTSIEAVIDGQTAYVPAEPTNRHYAAILASGVTIDEADDPASAFPPLEPWQFNAQIEIEGLSGVVDAVIEAIPDAADRAKVKARRLYSRRYLRDDPLFASLAPAVWPEAEDPFAELDAIWLRAAAL